MHGDFSKKGGDLMNRFPFRSGIYLSRKRGSGGFEPLMGSGSGMRLEGRCSGNGVVGSRDLGLGLPYATAPLNKQANVIISEPLVQRPSPACVVSLVPLEPQALKQPYMPTRNPEHYSGKL